MPGKRGRRFIGPYLIPLEAIPTILEVQRKVAEFYGLPLAEMRSQARSLHIARPRQVAMYLASRCTYQSMPQIGRRFGNRDHTTVIHAIRRVEQLRASDSTFDAKVRRLEARL